MIVGRQKMYCNNLRLLCLSRQDSRISKSATYKVRIAISIPR